MLGLEDLIDGAAGIIFDCDGTLADTMPAHFEAWRDTVNLFGLTLSEDRFYALGGWPTLKMAELLVQESGSLANPQEIAHEKETRFEGKLRLIRPIEPVVRVARDQHGKRPIAVATGATRPILDQVLEQIGLAGQFDALVTSDEVPGHKPAPDIFLEAARRLKLPPGDCLVFEDTDPGVQAAAAAGMRCIDVRKFYTPRRVTPPGG